MAVRACNQRLLNMMCGHLALFLLLLHSYDKTCCAVANQTESTQLSSQWPFSNIQSERSMVLMMVILVLFFFLLGACGICTLHWADRRNRGRLDLTFPFCCDAFHRGLAPKVINNFPTFEYSAVKGLKIGKGFLECAVCLNEFEDDETLRLLPTCNHVFHYQCIDVWLSSHNSCPVCRADLSKNQKPAATAFVAIMIEGTDNDAVQIQNQNWAATPGVPGNESLDILGFKVDRQSPPCQSREPQMGRFFSRSLSTGHSSPVQANEDSERFTLSLPEDARSRLVNGPNLSRTKSCVAVKTMRSSRKGYRGRSEDRGVRIGERRRYRTWTAEKLAANDDSGAVVFQQDEFDEMNRKCKT